MKTVLAVYTGRGLDETVRTLFEEMLPGHRIVTLVDDSLIADVVAAGGVTEKVIRRLIGYYLTASDIGADLILNTCSSVGEVVSLGRKMIDIPILRIDEPMADVAIERFDRIGVIATLSTTLRPTVALLTQKASSKSRKVEIVDGLAEGAYDALVAGKPDEHDRRISETAKALGTSVDGIVLAQGSMFRMAERLEAESGIPVLASPRLALERIYGMLTRGGAK